MKLYVIVFFVVALGGGLAAAATWFVDVGRMGGDLERNVQANRNLNREIRHERTQRENAQRLGDEWSAEARKHQDRAEAAERDANALRARFMPEEGLPTCPVNCLLRQPSS